jgi:hypothetical protein
MSKKVFAAILVAGCAGTIGAAAVNPSEIKTALAATGAAMIAATSVYETQRSKQEKRAEAVKVAQAFKYLYEKYRGIISPQELSFQAEVPLDRTAQFLDELIAVQNGNKVDTPAGTIYTFPHPQNALDQLTANAQEWARAQVEPLALQNTELKKALTAMQQPTAVSNMRPAPFVPTPAVPNEVKAPANAVDPWNNLL